MRRFVFIFPIFFATLAQAKTLVILDPGHGGEDTGAVRTFNGRRISEKELTLKLAFETAKQLRIRGFSVALTRTSDHFVALDKRAFIANRFTKTHPRSVFVSLHLNASPENKSAGLETYIFNATTNEASVRLAEIENGGRVAHKAPETHGTLDLILSDLATTANYSDSVALACSIQSSATATLRDRGVRQALFYVLMQTRMPGVLIEPGFLSNPGELKKLLDPGYQKTLAAKIAIGIQNYFRNTPATRSLGSAISAIDKNRSCEIR